MKVRRDSSAFTRARQVTLKLHVIQALQPVHRVIQPPASCLLSLEWMCQCPMVRARKVWGMIRRAGCPFLWWLLRRGSSSGMSTPCVVSGPGTAGAAEVHSDRRLLELWHLGFRVHHGLPAFPPQLAACAVVSERPRPWGWARVVS